ncbi:terminase [Amycolatopsis sp. Poz14]|nr:terminase [Amycolatopsis sp. Poz14]
MGRTEARLFTPPLVTGPPGPCGCGCAHTRRTTYGFAVDDFARDILEQPLDPWERWLVIHAGELLASGNPRFRKVLVIVARQNGKTHVLVVLSLYWLFIARVRLILGTSTNLDYARESWEKAVELIEEIDELDEDVRTIRRTNGEQALRTVYKSRYKIAASNRKGGRSLSVWRLILDELREHRSWEAWNAAYNAMNAIAAAQAFAITNQGDDTAVVLISLRNDAVELVNGIERMRPDADPELGLFEWSAPPGSEADDPHALAAANPNLGRRGIGLRSLLADARRAKRNGGEELAQFLTEILCMRVPMLDPAIDLDEWTACNDPGDLADVRSNIALCLELSEDGKHATLVAAGVLPDGRVRIEVVDTWTDTATLRQKLPALVRRIKPRKVGWFPDGPAASVAADLGERKGWPPPGVAVEAIRREVAAVCMGFAEQVTSGEIAHSDDPLLNAHAVSAERQRRGDTWVFVRRGTGHCDGVYAAAGAVHLARTLPPPVGKPRLLTARRDTT